MTICKKNQILNPKTGRCVKKDGKIGKFLLGLTKKKKESVTMDKPKKLKIFNKNKTDTKISSEIWDKYTERLLKTFPHSDKSILLEDALKNIEWTSILYEYSIPIAIGDMDNILSIIYTDSIRYVTKQTYEYILNIFLNFYVGYLINPKKAIRYVLKELKKYNLESIYKNIKNLFNKPFDRAMFYQRFLAIDMLKNTKKNTDINIFQFSVIVEIILAELLCNSQNGKLTLGLFKNLLRQDTDFCSFIKSLAKGNFFIF